MIIYLFIDSLIISIPVSVRPILEVIERIVNVCIFINCFNNVIFAHFEILVYMKRDYYVSVYYQSPSVSPHPPSLRFHFVLVFLCSFLCLPPTVQCMQKLSLGRRCIVPACEFLISSDMGPGDLATISMQRPHACAFWS